MIRGGYIVRGVITWSETVTWSDAPRFSGRFQARWIRRRRRRKHHERLADRWCVTRAEGGSRGLEVWSRGLDVVT